nr:MAG TPA: Defensin alpha-related sequence 1 antimicrobial peptide, cysteine-rich peptide [Caudoviricetes sp.]
MRYHNQNSGEVRPYCYCRSYCMRLCICIRTER